MLLRDGGSSSGHGSDTQKGVFPSRRVFDTFERGHAVHQLGKDGTSLSPCLCRGYGSFLSSAQSCGEKPCPPSVLGSRRRSGRTQESLLLWSRDPPSLLLATEKLQTSALDVLCTLCTLLVAMPQHRNLERYGCPLELQCCFDALALLGWGSTSRSL